MTPLTPWQSFYVVLGSAAGGLTGLQFVAMALIAEVSVKPGEVETGEAFATPAIVHFVAVLLFAASAAMPWLSLTAPAIAWSVAAAAGVAYMLFVSWRMGHQRGYQPVAEDWFFRSILPLAAYLALTCGALLALHHPRPGGFHAAAGRSGGAAGATELPSSARHEREPHSHPKLFFTKNGQKTACQPPKPHNPNIPNKIGMAHLAPSIC
ncbi:MAG: hypothetical protein V4555_17510 [Acidobacteriota bacterium]